MAHLNIALTHNQMILLHGKPKRFQACAIKTMILDITM